MWSRKADRNSFHLFERSAMQELHTAPVATGAVVSARGQPWRVIAVERHEDCVGVRLASLNRHTTAVTLLHPFDRMTPLPASERPMPGSRRRTAEAAAAAILDAHPWTGLQSALRADVRLLPYQLDPALAILGGEATRILLADEVGLGKTIQAGLILAELRARNELTRALIVTPAGLRDQWRRELADRFGVQSRRADAATLAEAGRTLPPWVNPWRLPGVTIVSIDLLKRAEVLTQLRDITWDLVIIDEAHHVAGPTDRGDAARFLCRNSRLVVLASATPHAGHTAFERLLDVGRLAADEPSMRVFRRTRGLVSSGILVRRTRNIRVGLSGPERQVLALLERYTSCVWRESSADARLAMIVLRKRALSGPTSLARSLARRMEALAAQPASDGTTQLSLAFHDPLEGELIAEDAEPEAVLTPAGLQDAAEERRTLEALHNAAVAATESSKSRLLEQVLERTAEPVIVFTEYRDTLEEIATALSRFRPLQLHGGMLPEARRAALAAFTDGSARILIATDAAAEGLNLHHRCRWVVHYELPWSASRLEQRTGRVDRLGQERRVHAWRLVGAGTDEVRILRELERRADVNEEELVRLVFEGEAVSRTRRRNARRGETATAEARAEAARLKQLRRLQPFLPRRSLRTVTACVRGRGPFATFGPGSRLIVRSMRADDPSGRRIAEFCWGALVPFIPHRDDPCPTAEDGRRRGRELARQIAAYRSFLRVTAARDGLLASEYSRRAPTLVQPSLFDRRTIRDAGQRRRDIVRSQLEVVERQRRAELSAGAPRVVQTTIATFTIR